MSFIKAFLFSHVINQDRKIYSGRHACLTKENVTNMLHASRRHHLCLWSSTHILALYQCWRSELKHTQKIITKCHGIITNCDSLVYYKVRWTVITNCDSFFITKCDTVYYKLGQVLQSAMDLLQIATGITNCDDYYKLRQYIVSSEERSRYIYFMEGKLLHAMSKLEYV